MSFIWLAGFLSTAAGIGLGGVLAWFLKGFQRSIHSISSLCSGLIIGLVSLEMAPEAVELGDWIIFFLGFLTGALLYELIHRASHSITFHPTSAEKNMMIHASMLLALSISVHNFPLGVILGSTTTSSLTVSFLQTLMFHNVPEGMILFTPLFLAGFGFFTWLFFSLLVALPVGLGSFAGSFIGLDHPMLWAYVTSVAVGLIVMVTVREILGESAKRSSLLFSLILSAVGFVVIFFYFAFI
ncbi:ZIP family metal transporter [Jeotgalibacillus proteolyticus]|uniref:Zinc permease n=1 Tax=Jeotgalibacillus proteolyticus TaxID=2082395 RepID=A0A2S5G817_9BACL|nr:ZIP family metal transporter [Jeotgalibacillus proteolyticus]PPA69095.1 zinc permease [Jeotgalibacillus proteolyticus]